MLRSAGISLLIAIVMTAVGCGGASSGSKTAPSPGPSPAPGSPSSAAVEIFPGSETLRTGGQRQFSGWDSTVGQYQVTWNMQEGAAGGSINAAGLYIAPSATGTFHLVATSIANPKLSASAPITVVSVGFVPSSDMAIPRHGHTATLLVDGRVLVAGGTTDPTRSAELFTPAQSGFTGTSGAMVHVRSGHCASQLQDGRVLIAGGDNGSGLFFTTAELFDPATQSFVATGDLNHGRSDATATLLPNGKVLIAGGQDSAGTLLSTAELYDPVTGSFTLTGNMQSPRAQHSAILLSNGKVLLVGSSQDTSSVELFDPATGLFTATGSLHRPRSHNSATLLPSGKVLVLGGTQVMPPGGGGAAAAPVSIASAELYDPATGVFQSAGNLLSARDSHSATLLPNGTVLVAGGYVHDFDGDAQSEWLTIFTAELFDPATSVSTAAGSLEGDRAEHIATLLSNGQILVTGGITGFQELCCAPNPVTAPLSSAEVYK